MGFNIAGVVINKNYQDSIIELGEELGLELQFKNEITFEEAVSNWKADDQCDVFFSEQGTLLFFAMDRGAGEYKIEGQQVFTFAISESSMVFSLTYFEGNTLQRSLTEFNGEIMQEDGEPLPEEVNTQNTSRLIFSKIGALLGTSFWQIENEAPAFRYKI